MNRRTQVGRGEGWVKLRVFPAGYVVRDGAREIVMPPAEALKLSDELRVHAYNTQGLSAPSREIELREAKLRLKRLEKKLLYRARLIGHLRALVERQWEQVTAAEAKATRWQNNARSLTGWSTPIHPKDTP